MVYYAVRSCDGLQAPAIFTSWEDCKSYVDQEQNEKPVEYGAFKRLAAANQFIQGHDNNFVDGFDKENEEEAIAAEQEQSSPEPQPDSSDVVVTIQKPGDRVNLELYNVQIGSPPKPSVAIKRVLPGVSNKKLQNGMVLRDFQRAEQVRERLQQGPYPVQLQFRNLAAQTPAAQSAVESDGKQTADEASLPATQAKASNSATGAALESANKQKADESASKRKADEASLTTTQAAVPAETQADEDDEPKSVEKKKKAYPSQRGKRRKINGVSGEERWNERFAELLAFKEQHGHIQVPNSKSLPSKLANWLSKQRGDYRRLQAGEPSPLTGEQIQKLTQVGFKFVATRETKSQYDRALEWLEYKTKHGKEPSARTEVGRWSYAARRQYELHQKGEKCRLPPDLIEKLTNWGFQWGIKRDPNLKKKSFDERIQELTEYKNEHGDVLVPFSHPILGAWVSSVRKLYKDKMEGKSSYLTDDKMAKLNNLGFVFKVRTRRFAKKPPGFVDPPKQGTAAAAAAAAPSSSDDEEEEEDYHAAHYSPHHAALHSPHRAAHHATMGQQPEAAAYYPPWSRYKTSRL